MTFVNLGLLELKETCIQERLYLDDLSPELLCGSHTEALISCLQENLGFSRRSSFPKQTDRAVNTFRHWNFTDYTPLLCSPSREHLLPFCLLQPSAELIYEVWKYLLVRLSHQSVLKIATEASMQQQHNQVMSALIQRLPGSLETRKGC